MNQLLENRNFFIRFRGANQYGIEFGFFDYIQIPIINIEPYLTFNYKQWLDAYNRRKLKANLFIDPVYPSKCAGLWFNQLKPGYKNTHQHDKFDKPIISWIDIDLKNDEQIKHFKRDLGDKNDFLDTLETNPYVWLIGETQSGGIRIGFIVDYQGNSTDPETIYKLNQKLISMALTEEYGYNYVPGQSTYADTCSNRISQPSFSLKWCVVNHDALTICNTLEPEPDKLYTNYINFDLSNDQLLISLYVNPTNDFIESLKHYSDRLGAIMKMSNHRDIWYQLLCKYYEGTSFIPHLKNETIFNKYLDKSKSLTYSTSLKNYIQKNGK